MPLLGDIPVSVLKEVTVEVEPSLALASHGNTSKSVDLSAPFIFNHYMLF